MSAGRWLTDLEHFGAGWRTQRSDLLIRSDGSIAAIEPASGRARPDGLACSGYLGMPGLVNAHFHSQSTLARGLNVGMEINEWGDESPAGRLQQRLFTWLDSDASDAEIEAICRWVVRDGEVTGFDPAEAAAGYRRALETALA